jgi:hypothetical protein
MLAKLACSYNARSAYLHSGEPMYLSMPIKGGERWDTDPTLGMTNRQSRVLAEAEVAVGATLLT